MVARMRFPGILGPFGLVLFIALATGTAVHATAPDQGGEEMLATQAMNGFAVDLYHRLSTEGKGENLFFSPFSIHEALTMTAEGARGETAEQMSSVLRFPESLHRSGEDAESRPWNLEPLHAGAAGLNADLSGGDSEDTGIRAWIAELRAQLDSLNHRAESLQRQHRWQEQQETASRAEATAEQLNQLLPQVDQYEIRVANALWGEQSYPFDPHYVETIHRYYHTGGVFSVDFKQDPDGATDRINQWVEDQTHERIRDLIPPGTLSALTRLVLTNAIYFKGEWSEPFKEARTKPRDFTLSDGSPLEVPMMDAAGIQSARYGAFNADGSFFDTPQEIPIERGSRSTDDGYPSAGRKTRSPGGEERPDAGPPRYPDLDGFAVLELPYKGEKLSMVLIAPYDPSGLPAVEQRLDPEALGRWIGELEQRKVHVLLPKFRMETAYGMGKTLRELGMVRAFEMPSPKGGAQFDGMTTSRDPDDRLFITAVLHKAFVDVDEKGTEAAAATAVVMTVGMAPPKVVSFVPTFKADRPFLFLIRDRSTGTILFLGRMMNPKAV